MRQTQKEKLLPEQTAEKIRGYIEGNGLKVGDKLPNEFQLAEICGVGRSTVREAIKLLVFSGKVEVIRGSGTSDAGTGSGSYGSYQCRLC